MKTEIIKISKLKHNVGQIPGVPRNPRLIKDENYQKLVQSIKDSPEMLDIREVIAYPIEDQFVVVMGNMRLTACKDLGMAEMPVKILPAETSPEKIKEYTIKDNLPFGEWDFHLLAADWNDEELTQWGLDLTGFDEEILTDERTPPEDFKEYDENINTEYECPKCGYKWSGKQN